MQHQSSGSSAARPTVDEVLAANSKLAAELEQSLDRYAAQRPDLDGAGWTIAADALSEAAAFAGPDRGTPVPADYAPTNPVDKVAALGIDPADYLRAGMRMVMRDPNARIRDATWSVTLRGFAALRSQAAFDRWHVAQPDEARTLDDWRRYCRVVWEEYARSQPVSSLRVSYPSGHRVELRTRRDETGGFFGLAVEGNEAAELLGGSSSGDARPGGDAPGVVVLLAPDSYRPLLGIPDDKLPLIALDPRVLVTDEKGAILYAPTAYIGHGLPAWAADWLESNAGRDWLAVKPAWEGPTISTDDFLRRGTPERGRSWLESPLPNKPPAPPRPEAVAEFLERALAFWRSPGGTAVGELVNGENPQDVVAFSAQRLREAEPFYVSAEMTRLLASAAASYPDDGALAVSDAPVAAGLCVLGEPVRMGTYAFRAGGALTTADFRLAGFGWVHSTATRKTFRRRGWAWRYPDRDALPALTVSIYAYLGGDPPLAIAANTPALVGYFHWIDGETIGQQLNDATIGDANPDEQRDALRAAARFIAALFTFVKQRIVVAETRPLARSARHRLARDYDLERPSVLVILLRRREYHGAPGSADDAPDWSCRWWVQGHWRTYTGAGGRIRPHTVWIGPYTKGPTNLPLKPMPARLWKVTR